MATGADELIYPDPEDQDLPVAENHSKKEQENMTWIFRQSITRGCTIRWAMIGIMALLVITTTVAATTGTAQAHSKRPPEPINLRITAITSTSITLTMERRPV